MATATRTMSIVDPRASISSSWHARIRLGQHSPAGLPESDGQFCRLAAAPLRDGHGHTDPNFPAVDGRRSADRERMAMREDSRRNTDHAN
jgi:hypothetical protein